jgi:hypothetical protein
MYKCFGRSNCCMVLPGGQMYYAVHDFVMGSLVMIAYKSM